MLPGTISPGTRLGGYRILGELGRGGMGVVLKAEEESLGRIVAVKVLPRELFSDAKRLERFRREAKGAAAVTHPNITTLYTHGEAGGWPYIVFEYMAGGTLQERIRRTGPIPWREVVRLAVPLARALGAIHAAGLIHRDLKPGNILLDAEGRPKLGDFGLVRREERGDSLTGAGELIGTASYLAPEQAGEGSVDHRADLYAFGATLYALLTGDPPFTGEGIQVIAKHLTTRPTPPRELVPEIPAALEKIVLRLLEKKPDARGQGGEALALELESLLGEPGPASRPPAKAAVRSARTPIIVGALVGLGALAVLLVVLGRPPLTPPARPDDPDPEVVIDEPREGAAIDDEAKVRVRGRVRNARAGDRLLAQGTLVPLTLEGSFDTECPPATRLTLELARPGKKTVQAVRTLALDPDRWRRLPDAVRPPALPRGMRYLGKTRGTPVYSWDGGDRPVAIEMVYVPRGDFTMGRNLGNNPNDIDEHLHVLTRGFFIGRNDVTWEEYGAYLRAQPDARRPARPAWLASEKDKEHHPVVNVSFADAVAFAAWMHASLPTEAQWEKTARGLDGRLWPWGEELRPNLANLCDRAHADLDDEVRGQRVAADKADPWWLDGDNDPFPHTSPVGSFPEGASPYGALDMAGNVYQWTTSFYDWTGYHCVGGEHSHPAKNRDGNENFNRVARGGSWRDRARNARSPMRGLFTEEILDNDLGFRISVEDP